MQALARLLDVLPEVKVTAKEMIEAVNAAASKLLEFEIITNEGYALLTKQSAKMHKNRDGHVWEFYIDLNDPLVFNLAEKATKNKGDVTPKICVDLKVDQSDCTKPPFAALDIAVNIFDEDNNVISRWHVDLANKKDDDSFQPGPLTHIQYGGHVAGDREHDHQLKVPRWCHPPMDILLLCEVITANFYPKQWVKLKEDRSWCDAISLSQKLCYSAYLRRLIFASHQPNTTILNEMDASIWS